MNKIKSVWCILPVLFFCEFMSSCSTKMNVTYRLANNYFLMNDVKAKLFQRITTQKAFEEQFGMAAFMGKDGEPTTINFLKDDVLALCKPETDVSTKLDAVSLQRLSDGTFEYTYQVTLGSKQTYTIKPVLLLIISKKESGSIKLKELTKRI